jgi:hypothetical protein
MQKLTLPIIALTLLLVTMPNAIASAEVSVGVKPGDWIQYKVNVTGNPPPDHNIKYASMNVTNVQNTTISLDVVTEFVDGTIYPEHITLNLAMGVLGDDFIIPKNLNVGDQFYDSRQGNITITGTEQRTAADAQRTVIYAQTAYSIFYWDRETGILVAATSHEPNYTMITETNGTNIWQPQQQPQLQILGLNPVTFYIIVATAVAITFAIVITLLLSHRKKSTNTQTKQNQKT